MSRKDQAYDYIRENILNNSFAPGTPLKEVELSKELNLSRSPIREALRELEMNGLVTCYPSYGTFVSVITPYDVEEVSELRSLCELWALEKGFDRLNTKKLDDLEEGFIACSSPFVWEQYHETDRAFHKLIVDSSNSKRLSTFVDSLNDQIERVRRYSAKEPDRAKNSIHEHLKIIQCIREKNLPAAKEALRVHLEHVSASAIEACKMIDSSKL